MCPPPIPVCHWLSVALGDTNWPAFPACQCSGETCSLSQKKPPGRVADVCSKRFLAWMARSDVPRSHGRDRQQLVQQQRPEGRFRHEMSSFTMPFKLGPVGSSNDPAPVKGFAGSALVRPDDYTRNTIGWTAYKQIQDQGQGRSGVW